MTAAAGLIVFSGLIPDVNCGAGSWDCATVWGVAAVSLAQGFAAGLCLTALLVLLSSVARSIWPAAPGLEPHGKAGRVSLALAIAHLAVFGALHFAGALPAGWVWWLGVLGLPATGVTGTGVYRVP